MRRIPWMQVLAHALLAVVIAVTALSFALLSAWGSPRIPGAGLGYRYLALGYVRPTGTDFAGMLSTNMIRMQSFLPKGYELGFSLSNALQLGREQHAGLSKVNAELVVGDYMQALHLRPLAGRLLTLEDQRKASPVAVLSESEAQRLFGHARDALGNRFYTQSGLAFTVIGVLPDQFRGVWGAASDGATRIWVPYTLFTLLTQGKWPGGPPKGDATKLMSFMGPAPLLSVPNSVSPAQLEVELARLQRAAAAFIPLDMRAFTVAHPYTPFPVIQKTVAHRIRLFLGLAIAALGLAAVNVLVLRWLAYLRLRATLRLERVLGARRAYMLRRFGAQTAVVFVLMLAISALLTSGFAVVLRHLSDDVSSVLTVRVLVAPLARLLSLIVAVVVVAQAVPLGILLARERLDTERTVSLTRADQHAGAVLLVAEVGLAALMSFAAAWALGYAWRSTHADIGFLNRPATLVSLETSNASEGEAQSMTASAQQLILTKLQQAAQAVAPNAATGAGPTVERDAGFDSPRAIQAGKVVTSACIIFATPSWIGATGVRLVAGRSFAADSSAPDDVLLDARLARALFGAPQAALGRLITLATSDKRPQRVIGVVAPLDLHGTARNACPVVVRDLRETSYGLMGMGGTLAVGEALDPSIQAELQSRLGAVLKRENTGLKVGAMRTAAEMRDWLAAVQIEQARVFLAIALFAWGIALSGVLALLRVFLAQRRRLIAIYGALGATPSRLYRAVVVSVAALMAIGALFALLAAPWLAAQFAFLSGAQVEAFGAATWIALGVLLLAVFAVVHFPACRAACAEPAESLHEL